MLMELELPKEKDENLSIIFIIERVNLYNYSAFKQEPREYDFQQTVLSLS